MTQPIEGETRTYERTFTVEDVQQFAELTGDDQSRHTEPDEDGRVMVQGLLTATLPTKLGSDNEVLKQYDGIQLPSAGLHRRTNHVPDRRSTRSRNERDRYEFTSNVVCENADGETVLTSSTNGRTYLEGRVTRSLGQTHTSLPNRRLVLVTRALRPSERETGPLVSRQSTRRLTRHLESAGIRYLSRVSLWSPASPPEQYSGAVPNVHREEHR